MQPQPKNQHTIILERFIVRPPEIGDYDDLKKLWGNPEVMKFVGFPKGLHISKNKILDWIKGWNDPDKLRLVIEDNTSKEFIGEIGYRVEKNMCNLKNIKVAALDIKLLPKYWGKGIAHETLASFILAVKKSKKINVFIISPNILNTKAINLYKKMGFIDYGDIQVWKNEFGTINFQYMILSQK